RTDSGAPVESATDATALVRSSAAPNNSAIADTVTIALVVGQPGSPSVRVGGSARVVAMATATARQSAANAHARADPPGSRASSANATAPTTPTPGLPVVWTVHTIRPVTTTASSSPGVTPTVRATIRASISVVKSARMLAAGMSAHAARVAASATNAAG